MSVVLEPIKEENFGKLFLGGSQVVWLGEVSVELVNDGEWLYMNTMNGICVKTYQGRGKLNRLTGDINRLRSGEGIDL